MKRRKQEGNVLRQWRAHGHGAISEHKATIATNAGATAAVQKAALAEECSIMDN